MPYAIVEVDIAEPLTRVEMSSGDNGIAVLVRDGGRPVDFWMSTVAEPASVTQEFVLDQILSRSAKPFVEGVLRRTLPIAGTEPQQRCLPQGAKICIAICTKDRPELLRKALTSVTKVLADSQSALGHEERVTTEVLVVDNHSSDQRTRDVVSEFEAVRYVWEPLVGLDIAHNTAIRETDATLLVYLDDDAFVDRYWLEGLLDAWRSHPDAAAFTGLVLPAELKTDAQVLFEQNGGFRRGFRQVRFESVRPEDPYYPSNAGAFGTGANMAFRREVLLALGGFDEALDTGSPLPGGGDHDILYRLIRSGHILIYEPRYLVFHQHRREMKSLRRQYYSWGTSTMAFITKTYQTDTRARPQLRRLVRWWFRNQFTRLYRSLWRSKSLRPAMVLAELWGGVVGILGEYNRSQRRIARIRKSS